MVLLQAIKKKILVSVSLFYQQKVYMDTWIWLNEIFTPAAQMDLVTRLISVRISQSGDLHIKRSLLMKWCMPFLPQGRLFHIVSYIVNVLFKV